jgi:hypothetical protein
VSKRWTIADIENLKSGKKKTMPGPSANDLTKSALRILKLKGFKCWRQNNAGVYDAKLEAYRAGSATPGISDILGFNRKTGLFMACEVKSGKDELSDDQEQFLEEVKQAGGIALVVRNNDDIEKLNREL